MKRKPKQKEPRVDELSTIAINLYNAFKSEEQTDERIKNAVEAALQLKKVDENTFYAVVAIGIMEGVERLGLGKEASILAYRAAQYFVEKSEYLRSQEGE